MELMQHCRNRDMEPLLSHTWVNMAGLNLGGVPGGGDANRASRFGFQVILGSQGLLAFLVVFLKVRTKGDQSCSPLIQAKTRIHSSPHPPTHPQFSVDQVASPRVRPHCCLYDGSKLVGVGGKDPAQ